MRKVLTLDFDSRIDEYTTAIIRHLKCPDRISIQGDYPTNMPTEVCRSYLEKAKNPIFCYPRALLSFATLKAGAQDKMISDFKCIMTRLPLFSDYTPMRWQKFLDVMLLGREMMKNAEKHKTLAPEQIQSRKNQDSIDLAVNKDKKSSLIILSTLF
jgi:hypothetical protein